MHDAEPLESRRLCAATPDLSFADGGRLSFSADYSVQLVLATRGEIYVEAYQRHRSRDIIFKYDDAGVLDANWGNGGYVVPKLFADAESQSIVVPQAIVRDNRTGGLLVGGVNDESTRVAVQRYTAGGTLDTAWGDSGRVAYAEAKTDLTLPRVVTLPHKQVMLALGRAQLRGKDFNGSGTRGGAQDVVLLKIDARGRYDRTFNGGQALTVSSGDYRQVGTVVDDFTTRSVKDYSVPTFGDIQIFADGTIQVVSTREETHQTTTTFNSDVIKTVGQSVFSAESAKVTAGGTVKRTRTPSYTLKRVARNDDTGVSDAYYMPRAAVASADGTRIAVLAETDMASGFAGGSILLRVGPYYRSRPQSLPAPFNTRFLGDVRRTGDGVVLIGSSGTGVATPDDDVIGTGPGLLSLGRDLAVGRNRVILPPTYFPEFSLDVYTFDDQGRLLVEGTNPDTHAFDLTRYA